MSTIPNKYTQNKLRNSQQLIEIKKNSNFFKKQDKDDFGAQSQKDMMLQNDKVFRLGNPFSQPTSQMMSRHGTSHQNSPQHHQPKRGIYSTI